MKMIKKIKTAIIKWSLNRIKKEFMSKISYHVLENYGIEDIIMDEGRDSFYFGGRSIFSLPKDEMAIVIKIRRSK